MGYRITTLLASSAVATLAAGAALADDQAAPPPATPPAAAPAPAAAAPAGPTAMTTPAMGGTLTANPAPFSVDLGLLGSKVYIGGAATGLGIVTGDYVPSDKYTQADISNGQIFINKTDGLIQYYIQVGIYSTPSLGTPYVTSPTDTKNLFGPLPVGYVKIVPNSDWSFEVGKLPTLFGAETTFTFENMNIERGLLWNQEPAVSRGLQINYTHGPLAISASWNDGIYSDRYGWLSGAVTWTFNSANILEFVGGGNLETSYISSPATPIYQNNEQIYNLIYTHTQGPWVIQPYLQYTNVPSFAPAGVGVAGASTWGGALLVSYAFDSKSSLRGFSIPFRFEYIWSNGSVANNSANLLYGPGSDAWSITITPTYQYKVYFLRGEFSYVGVTDTTRGYAFGRYGNDTQQLRGLIETGILF